MRDDVEKSTHHILFSFFTATQIHPNTSWERMKKGEETSEARKYEEKF